MVDDTPSGLLLFAICFGVISVFVLLLWAINTVKGRLSHMSSVPAGAEGDRGTKAVHVPVRHTGTAESAAEVVPVVVESAAPDTDAPEAGTDPWEMPRISTKLGDDDLVYMLAAQRRKDGKRRFSGNQIHALVGGGRADILAKVKAVQEGVPPPEFRPLTPEQQATREQLELPRR